MIVASSACFGGGVCVFVIRVVGVIFLECLLGVYFNVCCLG